MLWYHPCQNGGSSNYFLGVSVGEWAMQYLNYLWSMHIALGYLLPCNLKPITFSIWGWLTKWQNKHTHTQILCRKAKWRIFWIFCRSKCLTCFCFFFLSVRLYKNIDCYPFYHSLVKQIFPSFNLYLIEWVFWETCCNLNWQVGYTPCINFFYVTLKAYQESQPYWVLQGKGRVIKISSWVFGKVNKHSFLLNSVFVLPTGMSCTCSK